MRNEGEVNVPPRVKLVLGHNFASEPGRHILGISVNIKLMLQCEAGSAGLSILEIHLGVTITVSRALNFRVMIRLPRL